VFQQLATRHGSIATEQLANVSVNGRVAGKDVHFSVTLEALEAEHGTRIYCPLLNYS
jgi:hypothetical protein